MALNGNLPKPDNVNSTTEYFNNYFSDRFTTSPNINDAVIGYFQSVTGDVDSGKALAATVIYTALSQGLDPMSLVDEFRKLKAGRRVEVKTPIPNSSVIDSFTSYNQIVGDKNKYPVGQLFYVSSKNIFYRSYYAEISIQQPLVIQTSFADQTIVTTVATKTSAHIYFGVGSLLGYVLDGVEAPVLNLEKGKTYKFDQSAASNTNHPLRFYLDAAKVSQYSTGVTTIGTPGSAGAYTQIVVSETTPTPLFYQCGVHAYMGSRADLITSGSTSVPTFNADNITTQRDAILSGIPVLEDVIISAEPVYVAPGMPFLAANSAPIGGDVGNITVESYIDTASIGTLEYTIPSGLENPDDNIVKSYLDQAIQIEAVANYTRDTVSLGSGQFTYNYFYITYTEEQDEITPFLTVLLNQNRVNTSLLGLSNNPPVNKYVLRSILA